MHTSKAINKPYLEIFTGKFSSGNGSLIKLETSIDTSQHFRFYNYSVSAVFDQGSEQGRVIKPIVSFADQIAHFYDRYSLLVNLYILSGFLFYIFFSYYLEPKGLKVFFIQTVKRNLISVRRDLLDNPCHNKSLDIPISWNDNKTYPTYKKIDIIKDLADYALIDDFYSSLKKRNEYLVSQEPNKDDPKLRQLNEELISLISNILKRETEWMK
jgi:hypothetical protein